MGIRREAGGSSMSEWQGYGEQERPGGRPGPGQPDGPATGPQPGPPAGGAPQGPFGSGAAGYPPPGYGPAGYGQPGSPQAWTGTPGYGAGYGYPYGPPPRRTNTMAVLALVFAFVFSPLGLIFGIIARRQIRQSGEEGDGLALAGAIIGGVFTALYVAGILFFIVALAVVGTKEAVTISSLAAQAMLG
jgi:hypothetical protein